MNTSARFVIDTCGRLQHAKGSGRSGFASDVDVKRAISGLRDQARLLEQEADSLEAMLATSRNQRRGAVVEGNTITTVQRTSRTSTVRRVSSLDGEGDVGSTPIVPHQSDKVITVTGNGNVVTISHLASGSDSDREN